VVTTEARSVAALARYVPAWPAFERISGIVTVHASVATHVNQTFGQGLCWESEG
jgi:hypothetical protein